MQVILTRNLSSIIDNLPSNWPINWPIQLLLFVFFLKLFFGKYVLKEKDNSVSLNIVELKTKMNIVELKTKMNIVEFKEKKPNAFRS